MPPKKGNRKPKGAPQPKRKNRGQSKESSYNALRDRQVQRWRNEEPNQTIAKRQPLQQRQEGVAIRIRLPQLGMSDLRRHRITWIIGSIYIGNGTLGATNSVYLANAAGTALYTAGTGGGFWIPFAPSDADVGASYAQNLMKLYRRLRILNARVHLLTIQSSTTNNAVVAIAACRGTPGAAEWATSGTGTPAAQTLQNLMSVSGMKSCDSFENTTLELRPYVAGGSGTVQNEFQCAGSGATSFIGGASSAVEIVPLGLQCAGNSTVSALQGTITHTVVGEMEVDFLDFVGAVSTINPEGLERGRPRESKDQTRARLLSELSAIAREDAADRDRSRSKGKGEIQ